jgi:4-hydroxybutyryl-CoA dehydratase/vinylacetyl-CoA-Delta-isomerase
VSHIKDKLVEMTHLNETIYSTGIASSYQAVPMKSGVWLNDDMIANVCKHHVTRFPYEIARLAQDLAGGLMVTLPSEQDLRHPEVGALIRKYLKGRADIPTEDRMKILRLIENMTLGRNAVGYLTESMHGAGSPQAQRIQIARQMQLEFKKQLAKTLAGVGPDTAAEVSRDLSEYMARVFKTEKPS